MVLYFYAPCGVIAGYPQESVLTSTDSNIMTNLIHEAAQTINVPPFGTHPRDQRGPAVRLNRIQGVLPVPQGGVKTKSGHKSGLCQYCQKWFHRLSLHRCKFSPEVHTQLYISIIIALSTIISDVSQYQGTHRENVGSKRKAPPREAQMREDMQFKARQEDFLLEVSLISTPHQQLLFFRY